MARGALRLKGCGQCGGDLYLDSYESPPDWACFQCGARTAVVVQLHPPALEAETRGRRHYPKANLRVA